MCKANPIINLNCFVLIFHIQLHTTDTPKLATAPKVVMILAASSLEGVHSKAAKVVAARSA
jgi:hypothetical protein